MSKKKTTKDKIKSTKTKSTKKAGAREKAPAKDKQKQRPRRQKNKQYKRKVYPKDTERNANIEVEIKWLNDQQEGHNHIIGDSIDDKYVSIGLTTKTTPGKSKHKNIPLESRILNRKKLLI